MRLADKFAIAALHMDLDEFLAVNVQNLYKKLCDHQRLLLVKTVVTNERSKAALAGAIVCVAYLDSMELLAHPTISAVEIPSHVAFACNTMHGIWSAKYFRDETAGLQNRDCFFVDRGYYTLAEFLENL